MNNTGEEITIPQFIIEYFKALREEINIRLKKNANLWSIKITAAGFLFAYLGKSQIDVNEAYLFLISIVPWIVVVFDFLIADNLLGIHSIGIFIKYHIEYYEFDDLKTGAMRQKFWEHYCGQCQGVRTLEGRHLAAMFIFAVACAFVPVIFFVIYIKTHTILLGTVTLFLFGSVALTLLTEIILLNYFRGKIDALKRKMKEEIKKSLQMGEQGISGGVTETPINI